MFLGDLYETGIHNSALAILRLYLSDNFQKANINGEISWLTTAEWSATRFSSGASVVYNFYEQSGFACGGTQ